MGAFEEEDTFQIEAISPVWLVTALCIVPFGIYFLLNFLSPIIHRLTAMRISEVHLISASEGSSLTFTQIYIYPIKSLRAIKVTEAVATQHGFHHDSRHTLGM